LKGIIVLYTNFLKKNLLVQFFHCYKSFSKVKSFHSVHNYTPLSTFVVLFIQKEELLVLFDEACCWLKSLSPFQLFLTVTFSIYIKVKEIIVKELNLSRKIVKK